MTSVHFKFITNCRYWSSISTVYSWHKLLLSNLPYIIIQGRKCRTQYTTNLENSAVARELEKVSFHSNPKERQFQRMFKPLHNSTRLPHQQSNAQNSPSQASTVRELRTSRFSNSLWIQKRQRNQRSNCQHPLDHRKSKRVPEKVLLLLY